MKKKLHKPTVKELFAMCEFYNKAMNNSLYSMTKALGGIPTNKKWYQFWRSN